MFLLDTNVVSELRRVFAGKGDERVATWQIRTDLDTCFISALTLMEVEVGVCAWNDGIPPKVVYCVNGWKNPYARYLPSERWSLTLQLPIAQQHSTCPTHARPWTR